jgi:hypothetical protein
MTHQKSLTSHDLVLEIVQICTFHTLILCIENTFDTQIYWKMQNLCDIHLFIFLYFIHQHIYPCVKCVFNASYLCIKCMKLWMNKLCMIFIFNSSYVKFVMQELRISFRNSIFLDWDHDWTTYYLGNMVSI